MIGTTDIRYDGDLDLVVASDEEIDYLIYETNTVIPATNLTRDDVLFTYFGVRRPLPTSRGLRGQRHAGTPRLRPRRVRPEDRRDYLHHRRQAQDLPQPRSPDGGRCLQEARPEGPAVSHRRGPSTRRRHRHGRRLRGVRRRVQDDERTHRGVSGPAVEALRSACPGSIAEAGEDHSLHVPLSPEATVETGIIGAEVLYAFRREMAEKLGDVLLRRSMVGMGPRAALDVDEAAVRVAVQHLGWSQERAEREVREFRNYVWRYKPKDLRDSESFKA